jgi:hypothetical protein
MAGCVAYGEQVLRLLPDTEVIARTTGRLHVARTFHVTGDVTDAAERRAIAAAKSIRATGSLVGTVGAMNNVAQLQVLQGRHCAAAATYRALVQVVDGPAELHALHGGLGYFVGLGDLHREWKELDTADDYVARATEMLPDTLTVEAGYVTLGYLG